MKKILPFFLAITFTAFCKAQTYDTTTYYGKMSFILSNLSRTQITTGLLQDYGIDFTNPDSYSGKVLNDTNWVTLPDWRCLYATLYSEQIKAPADMPGLDSINKLIGKYAKSNKPVTFTCLYYNFNVLDTNAVNKNLITIGSNGQLNDVAGRTQSPYLLHSTFAVAPTQQNIKIGNNQLILQSQLFLGNTGKTISAIQIDPKGTGAYQAVSLNTAFTVNYSSAGLYAINFKITYTDGTINYSHTKIAAHDTAGDLAYYHNRRNIEKLYFGPPYVEEPGAQEHPDIFGMHPPYIPVDFTADKQYLDVAAKGDYTIDYAQSNTTGTIRKPLIIISGFDPYAVEGNDYLGLTYYDDYVQRMKYNWNDGSSIPLNGTSGLDNADSYDIIYLHWHNGKDYIERNAYLLEKLITIVNSIKTNYNGVRQQNVIIGTSMGGLIARWALRDMELNSLTHETRLFILVA